MLDFLVVGSGLTGATIARQLHDRGHRVLVVDRRSHHGGNVHDQIDEATGIRWHTYGPHYFRTNNTNLWEYVHRFADWYSYEPCLLSHADGELHPWPPTYDVVERFAGHDWDLHDGPIDTFEQACLAMMPRAVYEAFVKGYTLKQWGTLDLSPDLAGRFDVRSSDLRLKPHRHQGIPVGGYAAFMANLLDGIRLELGIDWLHNRTRWPAHHTVFTGPIDEYHGHCYGRLAYRGQIRYHQRHSTLQQPCGQVNNPSEGQHIRTLEWWHMLHPQEQATTTGSLITTETPFTPHNPDQYEYPFPDDENQALYRRYRSIPTPRTTICGRLGEYRYYDMDQAIGRALRIADRLHEGKRR